MRIALPTFWIGCGLLVLATIVFKDALAINLTATYGVGPTLAPKVVAGFLMLLGVGHIITAFKRQEQAETQDEAQIDWRAVGWVMAGLLGLVVALLVSAGFIAATAILFALSARGFGRTALHIDAAIGAGLGLSIYAFFTKLLTIGLPSGPLERLLF